MVAKHEHAVARKVLVDAVELKGGVAVSRLLAAAMDENASRKRKKRNNLLAEDATRNEIMLDV